MTIVAALILWAGAHLVVLHAKSVLRSVEKLNQEHATLRLAEIEAQQIRQRIRETAAVHEAIAAHVEASRQIRQNLHPEDDEPWKRDL